MGRLLAGDTGASCEQKSSMSLERHQRAHGHVHRAQFGGAAEIGQVDDEARRNDIGADLAEQFHRALGGAAGGDEIVDQDDALARLDRVGMHFHFIDAVFQRIGDPHRGMRQLAFLADRHEAGGNLMRHRAADDEASRLDAGDLVDLQSRPGLHQFIDRAAERARIGQQRGDVAKQDALLRVIRNGADGGLDVMIECHRYLLPMSFRGDAQHRIAESR